MDATQKLLAEKGKSWGDAVHTHARIAQVWSGILDHEVTPVEVALCMNGLKTIRAAINPDEVDSFDDGKAYWQIASDIIGHQQPMLIEQGMALLPDGTTAYGWRGKK